MANEQKKRAYCLSPCPTYDVEGMESWLTDMASNGLFLAKDGFFAGIAIFERKEPMSVKYRLEAAPKSTSIWSDNSGDPEPEAIELNEKYNWNYIARCKNFYIYASSDPDARELNTDPKVQALALNAVRKRQAGALFETCFWLILYLVLLIRGGLLLTMIQAGTCFFLFGVFLGLWLLADSVHEVITLSRLQKKLRSNGAFTSAKNRKKHTILYHSKNMIQIGLIVIFVCILLRNWSASVLEKNTIPLESYTEELPFATMADFVGEDMNSYHLTMSGMGFNTVEEWSDLLTPRNIKYDEHADIIRTDYTTFDGGLYINYHEAIHVSVAQKLALEYYHQDQRKKYFEPLEIPDLGVEYCVAYMNELHFPSIIIQHETVVMHATFYQSSDSNSMKLAEWAQELADSILEK